MVRVSFLPLNFPDYVLMLVLCFDDQDVPSWIGNVLLLKNNLSLSPDITEVSQEKLLSLVAERLIDSNSNVNVILCSFVNLKRCLVIRLILWKRKCYNLMQVACFFLLFVYNIVFSVSHVC